MYTCKQMCLQGWCLGLLFPLFLRFSNVLKREVGRVGRHELHGGEEKHLGEIPQDEAGLQARE
jgi:hypothetical protein